MKLFARSAVKHRFDVFCGHFCGKIYLPELLEIPNDLIQGGRFPLSLLSVQIQTCLSKNGPRTMVKYLNNR